MAAHRYWGLLFTAAQAAQKTPQDQAWQPAIFTAAQAAQKS